jgi:hypothetical protein
MPWDRKPVNPKYRSPEHRALRKQFAQQLKRDGFLICQQPECLNPSRVILPGHRWHLGHDETGMYYLGPVCARCNVVDGAKRGNARSRGVQRTPRRWVL